MSYRILLFVVLILIAGCKGKNEAPPAEKEVLDTSPWISLMDVEAWRGYNQDQLPDNWAIEDGVITCTGKAGDMGGDIITRKLFDNFELQLEWKISKGGNSGVFYHVVESPEFHSPYETGPEYQLLDDLGFPDPLEDWQKTGANYAMHNARADKKLMAVGEWNSTSIRFKDGRVEHWLNGDKILEFDKFSDDWQERRASGKWENYPDYGKTNSGHIGLQDHGAGVWFRNVRVRKL